MCFLPKPIVNDIIYFVGTDEMLMLIKFADTILTN